MTGLTRVLIVVVGLAGSPIVQTQLSLSGLVTDSASGAPIGGATVTVSGETPFMAATTLSLEDGRFRVDGLPPGRFTVNVAKPGFVDATYGSRWRGEPGRPVLLARDRPAPAVAVALRRSAALFGEVTDERGHAVVGATVTAFRVTQFGASRHADPVKSVRTDSRGRYRLFGLDSGPFVLSVLSRPGSAGAPPGMSEQQIDLMLQALREGRRSPVVQDESSERSTSSGVAALAAVFFPGGTNTGPIGAFDLQSGDEARADLRLPLSWAGSINGSVAGLLAGQHASVSLEPSGVFDTGLPDLQARGTSTDSAGTFAFRHLSAGTYSLTVRAESSPGSTAGTRWGRSTVEVGQGPPTFITIALSDGVAVPGRVSIAEGSSKPSSLPSLTLQLVPAGVRASRTSIPLPRAVTNSDGSFRFQDVPPGKFQVSVMTAGESTGWVVESVACGEVNALEAPCDVSHLDGRELVVMMTDSRTGVMGHLDGGRAFEPDGLMIIAFPTDEGLWARNSPRIKVARLASDGQFSFELPAGTYHLGVVTSTAVQQAISPEMLAHVKASSVAVVLPRGEVVRQDLRVRQDQD